MPEQRDEILKYSLDITEVEAKAQRLNELLAQIKAQRGAGEDTSELEAMYGKELRGLEKLVPAEKKAASTADELTRSKEKLGQVVGLLGGQFGGMIGQLGGLLEMLRAGNTAVLGLAAGLAALAIGAKIMQENKKAAEEATRAQAQYNEAVQAGVRASREQAAGMAESMEKWGTRSAANLAAAQEMQQKLAETFGVAKGRGEGAAALAVSAGLGTEDAARLNVLLGQGAQISTPEEAAQALAVAREKGSYDTLLETARSYSEDPAGRAVRKAAMAPQAAAGGGEMLPAQEVLEALKAQPGGLEASGLPGDLTVEDVKALLEGRGDWKKFAQAKYPGARKITGEQAEEARAASRAAAGWLSNYAEQVVGVDMGAGPAGPSEMRAMSDVPTGREAVRETVNVYNDNRTVTNNGSAYYHGKKQHKNWRPRMGASMRDVQAPTY